MTRINLETQMQETDTMLSQHRMAVGVLKDSILENPLLLSLEAVKNLTERKVTVFMEKTFGASADITDLEYADCGADILDATAIIPEANIILKYTPLTKQQFFQLKSNQIVISTLNPADFTGEMADHLRENKITALGLNHITDKKGDFLLEKILAVTLSKTAQTMAIGMMLASILTSFCYHGKIKNVLQLNPELLKSVYCYLGDICHPEVAQNAKVPWKDIVDLCWDWN